MKRILALCLLLGVVLAFVSCRDNEEPDRHFKDPTENVTDTEGEGNTTPTEPKPDDSENTVETPKIPFEDLMKPRD